MFSQPMQYYHQTRHCWPLYPHLNVEESDNNNWPSPTAKMAAGFAFGHPPLRRVQSEDYGYDSSDELEEDQHLRYQTLATEEEEVFHLEMGDESDSEVDPKIMTKIQSPIADIEDQAEHRNVPESEENELITGLERCSLESSYLEDVYRWKLSLESSFRIGNYFDFQTDITPAMRTAVLEWLVAVNRQFSYALDTWCLAVNLLDRFLGKQLINRDCLQLAGLTSFFIAAKHEEVEPPEIPELVSLCAKSYQPHQFRWMEIIILTAVDFEIICPSVSFFLNYHLEKASKRKKWPNAFIRSVTEKLLCEEILLAQRPSEVAKALYWFLEKNHVMTCLVANISNDETKNQVFKNFYDMLYEELKPKLVTN